MNLSYIISAFFLSLHTVLTNHRPLPALAGAPVHQLKVSVVLDSGMVHVHQGDVVVLLLSAGPSASRRTAPARPSLHPVGL